MPFVCKQSSYRLLAISTAIVHTISITARMYVAHERTTMAKGQDRKKEVKKPKKDKAAV